MPMPRRTALVAILILILAQATATLGGSPFNVKRKPRFISFDSSSGRIDINLDLSVPFLSIPLEDKKDNGGSMMPLVNVNTKALAVFGAVMAFSAFVIPLFSKHFTSPVPNSRPGSPEQSADLHYQHYRTDRAFDFSYIEDSVDEILFRDSRVTPCLQSIICSAVAKASRSDNPTNADKIIDGVLRWFDQAVNGTVIKEAVAAGRSLKPKQCIETYKGCSLNEQLIFNTLKIIGI